MPSDVVSLNVKAEKKGRNDPGYRKVEDAGAVYKNPDADRGRRN